MSTDAPPAASLPVSLSCTLRWDLAAITLVVALQLVYFTGVVSSDDVGYLNIVWLTQEGRLPDNLPTNQFFARFTFWKTIHLAVAILPEKPWAMVLPSMAASLGVLLILRAFARRHLDPRMSLVAMLAFGLVPINVVLASTAMPEMVATALGWSGVYLAAAALLERRTPRAAWRCLAGGLLIAAGYNAKETVALFVPGLILFVLLSAARYGWAWRRAGFLALGAGLWLGFEAVLWWQWTSDPWFHLHVVSRSQQHYLGSPVEQPLTTLLLEWTDYLRWLVDPRSLLAPMGMVLLAGVVYGLVKRNALSSLLLCVVVPPLVYLSVGSTDLSSYRPVIHQPRYVVPLLPGMALLTALLIGRIWRAGPWPRRAVTFAGILAIALSLVGPNQLAGRWYNARTFAAGHRLIADNLHTLGRNARLVAAGIAFNRFHGLPHWMDCPQVEMIWPHGPTSDDEWIDRYPGAYVIATRSDRLGPSRQKHDHLTLRGRPMACLTEFERVARQEPPRDRLGTLWARLLGRAVLTDPQHAVELWRVPTRAEWQVSHPTRQDIVLTPASPHRGPS